MSDQRLRKALIRLAHENPELQTDLLPLLKEGAHHQANQDPSTWAAIFDTLRKGQTIQVALGSVMSRSPLFDGSLHEWQIGRKSHSKKWGVTTLRLNQPGVPPPKRYAAVTLRKRGDRVSAAVGDMALSLRELRA